MADEGPARTAATTAELQTLDSDGATSGIRPVLPPPPPGVSEPVFSAALIQKPDMFASLSDDRKRQLFDHMDKADQRQADHAKAELASTEKLKLQQMADKADMRRRLMRFCYVGGAGGLVMFGALIAVGQTALAVTLIKDIGIGISLLLGGAGGASALKKYIS